MSAMSDWVLRTFPMDMTLERYRNLNGLHEYMDTVAELADNHIIIDGGWSRIVEVGIGSGLALAYWKHLGFEVIGIENDIDVMMIAERRFKALGISGIVLRLGDALGHLDLPEKPAVLCHEGLLEHFDVDDRRRMLDYQLKSAYSVLVDIPTIADIPKGGGFGDEHFQSMEDWIGEWVDRTMIRYYRRSTAIGAAFVSC